MRTFSLGLRNLLRNRRRSLATLLAMMIGLSAVLIFGGYASNVIHSLETAVVERSGHLEIQRTGYFLYGGENPSNFGIADYKHIINVVKGDPVLRAKLVVVTPELDFGGIAGNFAAGVSRSVAATGVEVDERNRMFRWNDYDVINYARPLPLGGTSDDTAVIGQGVARRLQLCGPLNVPNCWQPATQVPPATASRVPVDIAKLSKLERPKMRPTKDARVELLAANAHGAPNVINLNVVAAENMGVKEWDDVYLVMHLREAQRLVFGESQPQVTSIILLLKHTDQLPQARARLSYLLHDVLKSNSLEILDFETLNPIYIQSVKFLGSIFTFVAVLIGVIVLFTVGNTMSAAVTERTVEIGTLRAIGLRRSGLRRIFLCEGILLGVMGAVLGVFGAFVAAYIINHSGLTWTPPGHVYAYLIQISIWQDPRLLFGSAAGLILVAALSAWWPANRASGMHIVDALRHV